jgi:hypothetical protein
MSDWQDENHISENEQTEQIDQDGNPWPDFDAYSKKKGNYSPDVSPGKIILWVLIVVVIGWFLIKGYTTDDRYLQILGLSVLGVIVFSALVGMVRKERWSFWDSWIFFDGVELLFQIIVAIIRLGVEIIADKD